MSNKVIKSVSFNVKNPLDALMLSAIKRRNFSGYVKRLIAADINAGTKPQEAREAPQEDAPATPTQSSAEITAQHKLAQLKRDGGFSGPKLF
ncbi:hypothetical protein [Sporosarcina sp. ITBMC105]